MYQFRIQFHNSSCKEEESDSMSLHMNAKQFIRKHLAHKYNGKNKLNRNCPKQH